MKKRYVVAALLAVPTATVFLAWVYVTFDGLLFRYGRQPSPFGPRTTQPDPQFIAFANSYGVSYANGPSRGWTIFTVVTFVLFLVWAWNFFGAQKDRRTLNSEAVEAARLMRIRERTGE
jgi:hypothetical protein